ncbi:MAG TPA: hypothetical protein VN769_02015 [Xanthobacteraceae bacterium]|nr:hypothetical protein [Xanthobacteraceae bacterium]
MIAFCCIESLSKFFFERDQPFSSLRDHAAQPHRAMRLPHSLARLFSECSAGLWALYAALRKFADGTRRRPDIL